MSFIDTLQLFEFPPNFSIEMATPGAVPLHAPFEIKTCQRTVWVAYADLRANAYFYSVQPKRVFFGVEAYEYLLRFATGLESEIKGETDVFGQLKAAVKNYLGNRKDPNLELLFRKLFEDTKEIRAEFLHGIGGSTYGGLARRILAPAETDRAILVGAGKLAHSVAPYFSEFQLQLWNRSSEKLFLLKSELEQKSPFHIRALHGESELIKAALSSTLIIVTTPALTPTDLRLAAALREQNGKQRYKVLHLGSTDRLSVHHYPSHQLDLFTLNDLFFLEKEQSQVRQKQVEQALHACRNRARLRQLSHSIHIAHGWEDLALFN